MSPAGNEPVNARTPPVRVMLVDDHPMWRQAIRANLERAGVADIVAEASDGREAVDTVRRISMDVVLMDLEMPNLGGVDATREIIQRSPATRVLLLSASGEESDVVDVIKAGAAGYVPKSSSSEVIEDAVRLVARGEPMFTPSLAGLVLDEFRQVGSRGASRQVLPPRENEILRLVAKGYSYREIADRLEVSARTVGHYMQNILTRLHLRHEDALLDREDEDLDWDRPDGIGHGHERVLATLVFTDIVGSAARAAQLGDHRWRDLVESHHALVRRELARFHGREIDTTGDGFLAAFDQPALGVQCALAIARSAHRIGLEIRAGLHTGECERIGVLLGGIAVHIGARIAGLATSGEVLVSGTVKDLVEDAGLHFREVGTRVLKGVPGEWRLFAVEEGSQR